MGMLKIAATDSANFTKVHKRNMQEAEKSGVRPDDLTNAEKRGECFAPSVSERVLDKQPGFGTVKPTEELHQVDKGLRTLSSDSRIGKSPLPEEGVKLNIHGRRRDEHVIGRSATDVNDDCTVAGQDLALDQEGFGKRDRDTIKGKSKRDI